MTTDRPAPDPRVLLDLAGRWYRGAGSLEQAVRVELDLSATEFWRRINAIVDSPSPDVAVEFGPLLLRLRRVRDERRWRRRAAVRRVA